MSEGPYKVGAKGAIIRHDAAGQVVQGLDGDFESDAGAHFWCSKLNDAYALGAGHAKQAAAGTIRQLEADIANARAEINRLAGELKRARISQINTDSELSDCRAELREAQAQLRELQGPHS